jgi:hypothetical protein
VREKFIPNPQVEGGCPGGQRGNQPTPEDLSHFLRSPMASAISVGLAGAGVSTNQLHFLHTMIHKQLEDLTNLKCG